jgi:alpha-galactosidase/6-phospho-beta-glucosidase family protein
LKSSTRG